MHFKAKLIEVGNFLSSITEGDEMRLAILIIMLFFAFPAIAADINSNIDMRFSTTQKWGAEIIHLVETWRPVWVSLSKKEVQHFSPPPRNRSIAMKEEINELLRLQINRSIENIKQIKNEIWICGWDMGGYMFGMNKELDDFLVNIYYDSTVAGYKLKKIFDRVRPSFYDKRIQPAILVPKHPAYPSNHSIQAHILALSLSDIFPEKRKILLNSTNRITKNREIAGVHYSSDSELGKKVATTLHSKITQNVNYQKKVANLRRKYDDNKNVFASYSARNKNRCRDYFAEFRKSVRLNTD